MTNEQQELLLTVARLLKTHLSDHINNDYKYIHDDLRSLRTALKPFESNVTAIRPDGATNRR